MSYFEFFVGVKESSPGFDYNYRIVFSGKRMVFNEFELFLIKHFF